MSIFINSTGKLIFTKANLFTVIRGILIYCKLAYSERINEYFYVYGKCWQTINHQRIMFNAHSSLSLTCLPPSSSQASYSMTIYCNFKIRSHLIIIQFPSRCLSMNINYLMKNLHLNCYNGACYTKKAIIRVLV